MDCKAAREELLTGEVDASASGTPLDLHLAGCDECARVAAEIHEATSRLARELEPRGALEVVLPEPEIPSWRVRRDRIGLLAAGAGIAAVLALLVIRPDGSVSRSPVASGDSAPEPPPAPTITVPPGSNAIVFRTADPTITVVWFY